MGDEALEAHYGFFRQSCLARKPDEMATIIYTSGTTGTPKGVVLTHLQVISEISETFPMMGMSENDVTLSFLPYSHVFGRIEMWGQVFIGYTMGFAQSLDKMRDDMVVVRPTVLAAVPRLFEK